MQPGLDFIGISAGAVIVDADGRLFLACRGDGARDDQNKWEFPGGSVRMFENREFAAKRNIRDKYGLEVDVVNLLGVYDVIDSYQGDHWVSTTFICRCVSGQPRIMIPEKCSEIGWFTPDQVDVLDLSRISRLNWVDWKKRCFSLRTPFTTAK
ncbi:MAG: NUDIX domain-containing protein [bacterium]